ncbi:AVN_HP_G0007090.mRNA.1.CDS.1 [Saccharomyces cerevisiae]|nr:AVN_HP_G0007090.mRNA.1.CDS.1 [Saccharomyces cerevisiae]CAI6615455.1 AVN_HP_G0007090.mRNA.1.CDS.1 [Saccharomyces cerevisiae]
MALYYAPIFFAYLLSRSLLFPKFNIARLTVIAFTIQQLQLYSLIATVIAFLPAMIMTLLHPKKHLLPYVLIACSMSFFLFSFQVHEKTILIPLLPITLLYSSTDWNVLSLVSWINNVALFTLWPLLKKDGLHLQYAVSFLLSNWLIGNFSFITPRFLPKSLTPGPSISSINSDYRRRSLLPYNVVWKSFIIGTYIAMGFYHFLDQFVAPPSKYPDLWVLLNCAVGFICFSIFWLWSYYKIFTSGSKSMKDL